MAELDEQLFAYAAGELDAAERARIAALVASDARLRARLAWYEAVCDGVVRTLAPLDDLPSADEVLARYRGERRGRGFFAWLAGPALRPALGVAALLIVTQAALIALLALERPQEEPVRSAGPGVPNAVLVVAFDPQASEGAIRALLLQAGARIVDGPQQLGEYRLAVPANRAQFAESLLAQSKIVEYVRPEKR
jgi:hypothetical protein